MQETYEHRLIRDAIHCLMHGETPAADLDPKSVPAKPPGCTALHPCQQGRNTPRSASTRTHAAVKHILLTPYPSGRTEAIPTSSCGKRAAKG